MKNIFFLLFLSVFNANAQNFLNENSRNNHWFVGYANNYLLTHPNEPIAGGTCIDFNNNTMEQCYNELEFLTSNSSISDTSGNLLFYTNGLWVGNKNLQKMPIQGAMNQGFSRRTLLNDTSPSGVGWQSYRGVQNLLSLPNPGSNNLYTIFHTRAADSALLYYHNVPLCDRLLYSTVDMSQDSRRGNVINTDNPIINLDTLALGMLSACRHANGRDWWLIMWKYDSNKYMPILFDPSGVHPQGWQTVPQALGTHTTQGQTCFSPDGTRYARHEGYDWQDGTGNWLDIFDFDRCTGLLSNQTTINIPVEGNNVGGVAFSPNSQFLYANTGYNIFQYDMTVPLTQVASTQDTVGRYDGFLDDGWPTFYYIMQLAPNGKIYLCTGSSTRYLHVIDAPNNRSMACNVLNHSIHLNTYNLETLPNQAYFALGSIDSSACDTLGINNPVTTVQSENVKRDIKVFPNPTNDNARIEWNETLQNPIKIEVINSIGQVIETIKIENNASYQDIDTRNLPNGIYFIRLSTTENQTCTTKLIKISN